MYAAFWCHILGHGRAYDTLHLIEVRVNKSQNDKFWLPNITSSFFFGIDCYSNNNCIIIICTAKWQCQFHSNCQHYFCPLLCSWLNCRSIGIFTHNVVPWELSLVRHSNVSMDNIEQNPELLNFFTVLSGHVRPISERGQIDIFVPVNSCGSFFFTSL